MACPLSNGRSGSLSLVYSLQLTPGLRLGARFGKRKDRRFPLHLTIHSPNFRGDWLGLAGWFVPRLSKLPLFVGLTSVCFWGRASIWLVIALAVGKE